MELISFDTSTILWSCFTIISGGLLFFVRRYVKSIDKTSIKVNSNSEEIQSIKTKQNGFTEAIGKIDILEKDVIANKEKIKETEKEIKRVNDLDKKVSVLENNTTKLETISQHQAADIKAIKQDVREFRQDIKDMSKQTSLIPSIADWIKDMRMK